MTDDEQFCPSCFAGIESPQHHELCVAPIDTLRDELVVAEFQRDAARDIAAALEAQLARVEALTPTWHRGMYGCPDDMFSAISIRRALDADA